MPEPASISPAARDAILTWYDRHGRPLPFRVTSDPYAVLVSEAMAQQTQAARAGEAWLRFMARFPTIVTLANASPADVQRAWQGLGYNRRALNLWRAARRIVEVHDGRIPSDLRALRALPGIGPYTARAIAAIAFGLAVGAVDTNVRRVLGRLAAGDATLMTGPELQRLADVAVPADRPADWTHALMDVGATLCRPQRPDCGSCPARAWCRFAVNETAGRTAEVSDHIAKTSGRLGEPSARRLPRAPARETPAPFATTSRWLRGRIVERLCAAADGEWTMVEGPIGGHDEPAVSVALAALAREGLVELDGPAAAGGRGQRARLSTS